MQDLLQQELPGVEFSYAMNQQTHLNLCYKPLRNLSIRAGYGMGFRAPTLKEKYYNFDMSGIWIVEDNTRTITT